MECLLSYPCPPPLFSLLGPVTQGIMSNKEKRPWCILSFEHYRLFVFRCVSLWGRVDNCNLFMVIIYILFEIRIWICCVCHWYLRHIVFVFLVVVVFVACVLAGVWWGRVGFLSAGSICPQVRCSQARIKMIRISHRIRQVVLMLMVTKSCKNELQFRKRKWLVSIWLSCQI